LDATDAASGVAKTFYQIDARIPVRYDPAHPIALPGPDGVHSLAMWSIDRAGNEGAHNAVELTRDSTAPRVSIDNPRPTETLVGAPAPVGELGILLDPVSLVALGRPHDVGPAPAVVSSVGMTVVAGRVVVRASAP